MYAKLSVALLAGAMIAGCASSYTPTVDFAASTNTPENFDKNLQECRNLAQQGSSVVEDTAVAGVGGAALGAATGAIAGAILGGGAGTGAAAGAAIGGTAGTVGGAASGISDEKQMVRNCMRGRGYSVIG
ncbi:MAG: hypothetical protein RIC87_17605 [Kiloniellales bacterium]